MTSIGETTNYSILYELMNAPWHMADVSKWQRELDVILDNSVHIILFTNQLV